MTGRKGRMPLHVVRKRSTPFEFAACALAISLALVASGSFSRHSEGPLFDREWRLSGVVFFGTSNRA
jgi:hypothetical protein